MYCKCFLNIYCMCVCLYIHNKYTQNTYIMQTKFILDAINHLKALINITLVLIMLVLYYL